MWVLGRRASPRLSKLTVGYAGYLEVFDQVAYGFYSKMAIEEHCVSVGGNDHEAGQRNVDMDEPLGKKYDNKIFTGFVRFVFVGVVSFVVLRLLRAVLPYGDAYHNDEAWIPAVCIAVIEPLFRWPVRRSGEAVPFWIALAGVVALAAAVAVVIWSAVMIGAELRQVGVDLTDKQWNDSYHVFIRHLQGWTFLGSIGVIVLGRIANRSLLGRIAMVVGGVVFGVLNLWSIFGMGPSCEISYLAQ